MNEAIKLAAQQIDAKYDAMLYEGMPLEEAQRIESQRDAAHRNLLHEALEASIGG